MGGRDPPESWREKSLFSGNAANAEFETVSLSAAETGMHTKSPFCKFELKPGFSFLMLSNETP